MKINHSLLLLLLLTFKLLASTKTTQKTTLFSATLYSTPVTGQTISLAEVWPLVDNLLKTQYWYYLKDAVTVYESGVNAPSEFLFFTIYRSIMGTFLVITTWDKVGQTTQINTLMRIGEGYTSNFGTLYSPVMIDPFMITINLDPGEFMVSVNSNGSINVFGGQLLAAKDNTNGLFNVTADMNSKCQIADQLNRDTYWYYLDNAYLADSTPIPTSNQYYCVFIYVNVVGTFLSISHWDFSNKAAGINTFVRLGDGVTDTAKWGAVQLTPAVLSLTSFSS